VQHLISELPEQRLEVTVPEQQPAEIETQTPVILKFMNTINKIKNYTEIKIKIYYLPRNGASSTV